MASTKVKTFFQRLLEELVLNGKMLLSYLVLEIPGLSNIPGLGSAIETAMKDQTLQSYINLGIQVALGFAAAHRAGKIVVAASKNKSGSSF